MAIATTTLLTISVALAAVSAGVGAYASISAANARQDAAKYNAAVAKNNAMAAKQQADYEADRIRDRNRRLAAKQRNIITSSGITLSGSAEDVMYDSATQGELDVLSALYTGNIEAMNQKARSTLFGMEARSARTQGYLGAGQSILSGASDAFGAYTNPALNPRFKP